MVQLCSGNKIISVKKNFTQRFEKGYVTISSVLILGAIGMLVVVVGLSINTDNVLNTAVIERSKQAKALAESCVEITINTLKTNLAYSGNETLNLPFGSCNVSTVSGSGLTNRGFQVTATHQNQTHKISILISQVNPTTNINTWQEIP